MKITGLKIFLWSTDFIYLFILYFLQFLQILIGVDNKFLIDSTPLTIS